MMHRWNQHCAQAKNSKGGRWHFPNTIRKYGKDAFSHKVLEVCDFLETANLAEEKWIVHFDSRNPKNGFNLAKGGGSQPHPIRKNPWNDPEYRARNLPKAIERINTVKARSASKTALNTPESKEKRSAISKEIMSRPGAKEKIVAGFKGKKHDLETRLRLIESNKSRSHSQETRLKISKSMKGKKPSDLARERARIASTGRTISPEHRAKLNAGLRFYYTAKAG